MVTIAVANAKGGTGKTTLAVHLAVGLAREGRRVLLADLDPQGNASSWLLGALPVDAKGTAEALSGGSIEPDFLRTPPGRERLSVLPATQALAGADLALAGEVAGETILRRALEKHAARFDYAILDCPPTMGLTVLNALCAAQGVVAPVLGAFLSLAGLRRLEETVSRIRERLHVPTQVLGYVLFAADPREAITGEARDLLRREAGDKLFKAEIRVSTAAKALPAHRKTAWDAGVDDRGAEDYPAVIEEMLQRIRGKVGAVARKKRA